MSKRFLDKVFKQHFIGGWGRFSLASSQIGIFVSSMTFFMVGINAFIPVSQWFMQHDIYLRLWVFMAIIIIPILIAYFIAWKFLVASFYRSSTEQFWNQNNPIVKEIEDTNKVLKEELKQIKDILKDMKKK